MIDWVYQWVDIIHIYPHCHEWELQHNIYIYSFLYGRTSVNGPQHKNGLRTSTERVPQYIYDMSLKD